MNDRPKRILAVDYGDSRTGLAATDWTGTIAIPLPRIDERDPNALIKTINELVSERETQLVVLGMPLCHDGTTGDRANIWRLPLDGGEPERLTDFDDQLLFWFGYSPDGETLALARGELIRDAVLLQGFR